LRLKSKEHKKKPGAQKPACPAEKKGLERRSPQKPEGERTSLYVKADAASRLKKGSPEKRGGNNWPQRGGPQLIHTGNSAFFQHGLGKNHHLRLNGKEKKKSGTREENLAQNRVLNREDPRRSGSEKSAPPQGRRRKGGKGTTQRF